MADDPSLPDDIDELMKAFGVEPGQAPPTPPPAAGSEDAEVASEGVPPSADGPAGQDAVDQLLQQEQGVAKPPPPSSRPQFQSLGEPHTGAAQASIEMLKDVSLNVRIEIGRTKMYIQDILKLGSGSVVELNRLTGDPLDLYVNDRLVARGEVLVINENFAIRITEVIQPSANRK